MTEERDTIARAAAALDDSGVTREATAQRAVDPLREALEPLFSSATAEAAKAMRKFPQPNYVISKVAEEAGEVVKAAIHCAEGRETPENVVAEIRQAMAMLIRLYVEGDQVHGLSPLAHFATAPQPKPKKTMCNRCDGGGYAWAVGTCPDCGGSGWITQQPAIAAAPQPAPTFVGVDMASGPDFTAEYVVMRREAPAPRAVDPLREAIAEQLSEGLGAILRKFCDSPEAAKARHYLHAMPPRDWDTLITMLSDESARAALAAAPQPAPYAAEACRELQAEPARGAAETPYDRGYVWGYRHGLLDGKAEVAPQPAPVDRETLVEVIREAGNRWNGDDPADYWRTIAAALIAAGLRLPGAVQPDETPAWAVVGKDGEISLVYLGADRREIAELIAEVEGKVAVRVAIRIVEDGA